MSSDNAVLETLCWLINKGDTSLDMWKHRLESDVSEEVKLKEKHKYTIYDRFSDVAFCLQMSVLGESIYEPTAEKAAPMTMIELDWDSISK